MTGKTEEEIIREREEAIKRIKELYKNKELEIIDSYIKEPPETANKLWFLGQSLCLLSEADIAYFVKHWDQYESCKVENICAHEYGIETIEE